MDCLCGSVITSVTNCGLHIFPFLRNEREEASKLDDNWRKLQSENDSLEAKRKDIEDKIKDNNIMKKTTNQWEDWVTKVKKIGYEVKSLEKKYRRAKRIHYITCRFLSHAKLSRDMATKANEVYQLADRMKDDIAMTDGELTASANPSFRKIPELTWVKKNVDRIIMCLQEENVKKIGVWAFAGMGKTTIMESLKDNLLECGLFEHVLFVTVEEEDSEARARQSILEQLKPNIVNTVSSHQTAHVISKALEKKKIFADT